MPVQNGTIEAHGRSWPLYERPVTEATVTISVNADEGNPLANPETLRACLEGDLRHLIEGGHQVDIEIGPVLCLVMSPEDKAEKEELDRSALAA